MVLSLYYRRPVHLPNDLLDCLQQQRRRARRAHESARPTHWRSAARLYCLHSRRAVLPGRTRWWRCGMN